MSDAVKGLLSGRRPTLLVLSKSAKLPPDTTLLDILRVEIDKQRSTAHSSPRHSAAVVVDVDVSEPLPNHAPRHAN